MFEKKVAGRHFNRDDIKENYDKYQQQTRSGVVFL